MKDVLDYGTAIERLRERRGLSREDLATRSGVSYSYLSEVERGLKRPSTDVLVKLATALEMLPSDLLRQIEEFSSRRRGLFRRRVYEAREAAAPLHEHAGGVPQAPAEFGRAEVRVGLDAASYAAGVDDDRALLNELMEVATSLASEDLRILLDLARRLSKGEHRPR